MVWLQLANLALYCVQQLGIMLGVGAETIALILYLVAAYDGTIDPKEQHFLHATRRVLYVGLFCIIASGALITFLQLGAGQAAIVFSPAYLFKWALIGAACLFVLLDLRKEAVRPILKGLAGGTWFALFAVHVLAPVTTWMLLGAAYAIWMGGFMLCWLVFAFILKKRKPPVAPAPAPIQKKTDVPKKEIHIPARAGRIAPPAQSAPVPAVSTFAPRPAFSIPKPAQPFPYANPSASEAIALHPHVTERAQELPLPPLPPAAGQSGMLPPADVTAGLPAVRVMPQRPEDLETQHRAPMVRFG